MAIGQPVIIKPPKDANLLGVSHLYKCLVSGDPTNLSTADTLDPGLGVNIFIDTADSGVMIPLFCLPSGTIVEDFGFQIFQVWTSDVNFMIGDSADEDGWGGATTWLIATDTGAATAIKWASHSADEAIVGLGDTTILADTVAFPVAYLADGPRVVYHDTASTGCSGVFTTDVINLDAASTLVDPFYAIYMISSGAVVASGGMNLYVKVNFANLARMCPSSDMAVYG